MRSKLTAAAISLGAAFIASLGTVAGADVVYDETAQADVSSDYQNPTPFSLSYGVNSFIFTTGYDDLGEFDLDFVRVDVPAGGRLTNLFLADYIDGNLSFLAFQEGAAMTFDPEASGGVECFEECVGFTHFGFSASDYGGDVGGDLFEAANIFGPSQGGPSFDVPLPGSQYTFWLQETDLQVTYQLDYVVSLPGDYNGDHFVNAADYTVWRNHLGETVEAGASADGDFDTDIDHDDFQLWKTYYGEMAIGFGGGGAGVEQQSSPVPEPGTGLLLIASLAAASIFIRRSR